jgi:hypothetical protein
VFLIDEIDDEAAQVGGVLDLVLGFAKDDAQDAGLLAEIFERVAVMFFERDATRRRSCTSPRRFSASSIPSSPIAAGSLLLILEPRLLRKFRQYSHYPASVCCPYLRRLLAAFSKLFEAAYCGAPVSSA